MWTKTLTRTKVRAALIHFSLSLLIFSPILYEVVRRWYPGPLFFTDGGWQGMRIMVLIDLVLGPVLTFTVFNPAKTRLALAVDFSFIGVMQIGALIYGVINVSSTAIWSVAFSEGAFAGVSVSEYKKEELPADAWHRFGKGPPYWVYIRLPKMEELGQSLKLGIEDSIRPQAQFFLTEPLRDHLDDLRKDELKLPQLTTLAPDLAAACADFSSSHQDAGEVHFYRMSGFYNDVIVALNGKGEYVGFINRAPPKIPAPEIPPPKAPAPKAPSAS